MAGLIVFKVENCKQLNEISKLVMKVDMYVSKPVVANKMNN